jgi:hypothetical protein
MTHDEAWTFYFACYLPSIGYPLASLSLTYQQLDRVQRRAMTIMVAKCGYNRNTKRAIIYGPLCYGGANFRHLYVQQGVGQVTSFLKHWREASVVGKLLQCALTWTQMTAGTSISILQDVSTKLPHLESKWLASLRLFLSSVHATIEVDKPGIPPIQREHDQHLMDIIITSGRFTSTQIRRLNYCRLFLQTVTISDIATTSGFALNISKRNGHPLPQSSETQWLHVNQEQPSNNVWRLWKKANLLWSDVDGKLHLPLGKWTVSNAKQQQRHHPYKYGMRLAIRTSAGYAIYERFHQSLRYVSNDVTLPFNHLPLVAHPTATTYCTATQSFVISEDLNNEYIAPAEITLTTPTFEEFLLSLEPWERDLLQHTEIKNDPTSFCDQLSHGFRAVSDGSVRYNIYGAFGWIMSTPNGERVVWGMGPAYGMRPQSYRAEGYGLLSILRFLIRMAEFTEKTDPWSGIIGTDSLSVLDTLHGKAQAGVGRDRMHAPIFISGEAVVLDDTMRAQIGMS